MLIDRPEVTETSQIVNATVASGSANPANPDIGELFYRTDLNALVVFTGASWVEAGAAALTAHTNDPSLHLSPAQNTLLDGLNLPTLTAAQLNTLDTLTTGTKLEARLTTITTSFSTHLSDTALHLTPAQNTLLDGLAATLTAVELNYVDGVTGPIQSQLDTIVSVNNSQNTTLTNLQNQINTNASGSTAALNSHIADTSLHLTSQQNAFLDGLDLPTLTPTEVNFLSGVTSNVQAQFNTINANRLHRDGSITMQGSLQMGNNRIVGLAEPVNLTDAATKNYVDNAIQGLHWAPAVRVATTVAGGNVDLSTAGLATIDGVALALGDRVLVKNQTNAAQNGIYLVGNPAWSRAPDADTAAELDGEAVFVREGTVHADSAWVQVVTITTLGVSPVTYSQFAAAGGLGEGQGIQIVGAIISVRTGNGLTFSGNNLTLNTSTDFTLSGSQLQLAPTAAPAGTYGSGTDIPVITTDGRGRITGISTTSVAGAFQPSNANLTNLSSLSTIGLVTRTSSNTFVTRSLGVSGIGLSITNADGNTTNPTITSNATSSSTANTVVARDGSGNFSAGTITANLTGTASANVLRAGDTMSGALTISLSSGNLPLIARGAPANTSSIVVQSDGGAGNAFWLTAKMDGTFHIGADGATEPTSGVLVINPNGIIGTPSGFALSGETPPSSLNAFFSTPAYGISQGDNRTHFGYNDGGTYRNFIRGVSTLVDGSLAVNQLLTASSGVAAGAVIGIYNPTPVLILEDTNSSGAAQMGYISFRDNLASERAWFGYGSAANTDLTLANNQGDVTLMFSSTNRFRFNSSGQLTILGTTNTGIIDGSPTTYGTFRVSGMAGGYAGFQFPDTSQLVTFMTRPDNLTGVYQSGNNVWQWYWDPIQSNIRIGGTHLVWHGGNLAAPAVATTANTLVQRDGSGYAYAVYFNQSSPNNENPPISQLMVTNGSDSFLRKASIAHLASSLGEQTWLQTGIIQSNGAGAVGTNSRPASQAFEFFSSSGQAATTSFHRLGQYAINMGLDTDNTFRIGGWSDGAGFSRLQLSTTNAWFPNMVSVQPGDGRGYRFWDSDSYKISMGVGSLYQFGPVQDYSIKMQMDAASTLRGFTWGREGVAPVAGLNSFNGNMQIAGAFTAGGDVTAFSDRRLKTDIKVIEGALHKVGQLEGVTFRRLDTDDEGTGLIAQDVLAVLPQAVRQTEEGTLTVAYGNLVGLLVEAIKELKAELDELKKSGANK